MIGGNRSQRSKAHSTMNSTEVELAVTSYLDVRKHIIVPNVYWGMFKYELDLCALDSRSFYAKEIEIKVSRSDLKRDLQKTHGHKNDLIKYLWFAMPETMRGDIDLVPERAGIYLIHKPYGSYMFGRTEVLRKAKANPKAKKWSAEQAAKLGRLGTMRFWDNKKIMFRNEWLDKEK